MTVLVDRHPMASGATSEPTPAPELPDIDDAQQYYLAGSNQGIAVGPVYVMGAPVYIEPPPGGLALVLRKVVDELSRLGDLQSGWDGRRARRVTREAIYATAAILGRLLDRHSEAPQFFPLPGGGIQVMWCADEIEIEIEIDSSGEAQIIAEAASGEVIVEGIIDSQESPDLIRVAAGLVRRASGHVAAER